MVAVSISSGVDSMVVAESAQWVTTTSSGVHSMVVGPGVSGTLSDTGGNALQLMPPFSSSDASTPSTGGGGGGGGGDLTLDVRCARLGGVMELDENGSKVCVMDEPVINEVVDLLKTKLGPAVEYSLAIPVMLIVLIA